MNNLTPLLFVVFETSLGISIGRISLLITVNFGVQMLVDLLSAKWINVIGTRRAIVAAHAFAAAGLVALGVLPYRTADPYVGVLCAVCLCAVGGGITEVLISPIVEALPSEDKAGSMSLLHAFYCWGHVGVVVLSTLYFALAGTGTLGAAACAVGRAAAVQHGAVRAGAAVHAGGRRAPHAAARTAEKQNDLAVPFDDGMCGRVRAGDVPVGVPVCRNGPEGAQSDGRPAGPLCVCGDDGPGPVRCTAYGARASA